MHDSFKFYSFPFRTLWLRSKDAIDLRMTGKTPAGDTWTTTDVIAHIADFRLVGVSVQDHKKLGLGRWLRAEGEEVDFQPDEPLPSQTVRYDEAGRIAYFSVWPLLSAQSDVQTITRPGKIYYLADGSLARIRLPVTDRRGRAGALGAAAGLLATR